MAHHKVRKNKNMHLDIILKNEGISAELHASTRDFRLIARSSTLSVRENGRVIYQMPLEGRDIKTSVIRLVLKHLDAGYPLPLVAYYLGDGVVRSDGLWKGHVKITEGGRRLVITHQLLQRLAQQDPNTAKTLNEKT